MYNPKPCPQCAAMCMESDARCHKCGCALSIGWVSWLPGISCALFGLLMAVFVFFYAPKAGAGVSDKVATGITSMIFIGGGAIFGAVFGWVLSLLFKSANRS